MPMPHLFPMTAMPIGLFGALIAITVPRTVLAQLDVVPPESGALYYVLALVPYACWYLVAALRPTPRPLADHLMLGTVYGVTLVVIHQALWASEGNIVPRAAHELAEQVPMSLEDLTLRLYTVGVSMVIGIGSGAIGSAIALLARWVRRPRTAP